MLSIPQLTAENVLNYIKDNYSGSYNAVRQFDGEQEYEIPAIMVGANSFTEIFPGCGVYQGTLAIEICSQIDEITNSTVLHDTTANEIIQLLSNRESLFEFFNGQENGHIWGFINSSYGTEMNERFLSTIAEYEIHAQNLGI